MEYDDATGASSTQVCTACSWLYVALVIITVNIVLCMPFFVVVAILFVVTFTQELLSDVAKFVADYCAYYGASAAASAAAAALSASASPARRGDSTIPPSASETHPPASVFASEISLSIASDLQERAGAEARGGGRELHLGEANGAEDGGVSIGSSSGSGDGGAAAAAAFVLSMKRDCIGQTMQVSVRMLYCSCSCYCVVVLLQCHGSDLSFPRLASRVCGAATAACCFHYKALSPATAVPT